MQGLTTLRAAMRRARRRAVRHVRHVRHAAVHGASLMLQATAHWAARSTAIEPAPLGVLASHSLRARWRERLAQWVHGQRVDAWHRWARRRYAAPVGHPFPEAPQTIPRDESLRDLLSARHHMRRTIDALWNATHNWSGTDPQIVPMMRRLVSRLGAIDRGLPLEAARQRWGDTDPTAIAHLRRAMAFTYEGYRALMDEPDTWVATALLVHDSEMLATEILHQIWIRLGGVCVPDAPLPRPVTDAPGQRAAWTQTDDWWADLRRLAFAPELESGRAILWGTTSAQAAMLPPPPVPGTPEDLVRLLQSPWAPIRLSMLSATAVPLAAPMFPPIAAPSPDVAASTIAAVTPGRRSLR